MPNTTVLVKRGFAHNEHELAWQVHSEILRKERRWVDPSNINVDTQEVRQVFSRFGPTNKVRVGSHWESVQIGGGRRPSACALAHYAEMHIVVEVVYQENSPKSS